ncbi:drug/metabolite transporter (DMT)-like permease [Bradyrhizobium sp. GM0.4]
MKRSAQRLWLRSVISKCPIHERICFLGLVLFSAVARAIWNSLVKSAGDRRLTMVMIRFTGSCWALRPSRLWIGPYPESWKWLFLTAGVQFGYYALLLRSYASVI